MIMTHQVINYNDYHGNKNNFCEPNQHDFLIALCSLMSKYGKMFQVPINYDKIALNIAHNSK